MVTSKTLLKVAERFLLTVVIIMIAAASISNQWYVLIAVLGMGIYTLMPVIFPDGLVYLDENPEDSNDKFFV